MPIEDGMSKATKNLDKAAQAAPTSKVVHANESDAEGHDSDARKRGEEGEHNEGES